MGYQFKFAVNQDCDCICIALDNRIAVFATLPNGTPRLKTIINQSAPVFSPAMLHKTNVLAFVAGAKRKRVKVFDDLKQRTLIELDSGYSIGHIILRRDCIITLSTHALSVYALSPASPSKLYELPMTNINHVAASASRSSRLIVVTETQQRGHIQILDLTPVLSNQSIPSHNIVLVKAHDSSIRAIAVSPVGNLVATTSDRGTLIRIWDVHTGSMVRELRRGSDPALVHSLLFSHDGSRLVVVSDKATVHIFHISEAPTITSTTTTTTSSSSTTTTLRSTNSTDTIQAPSLTVNSMNPPNSHLINNSRSQLSFLTPLLPSYFNSEWSFASCKIPLSDDPARLPPHVPPLLAWLIGDSNKVMIAAADGRIWRFTLDCRRRGSEGVLDGVWRVRWPDEGDGCNDVPSIEDL